jgi:eukaryotic-like serine/threonine-protein kinase
MTGRIVHHYRIHQSLGAGGMGEVYRAEDTRLGRQVALKFLPSSYQYDIERRERFLKEARAASALRSPHIAAIYDIGEHEGSSYIVMELVEGESLSDRLLRSPLAIYDAVDVAMQVADALDEAHSLGIVHRDIKSSNLMITARGLVKVLDFGLAKMTAARDRTDNGSDKPDSEPTFKLGQETVAGVVLGTVSYMSPEQALGRQVDQRSDIFSLGVVIYETITGRLPFEGDSETEIIDRILHHEPVAVARFNYSVPQELERILRKALQKDLKNRYQSVREMHIDLRNLHRDLEENKRTGNIYTQDTDHQPTAVLVNPDLARETSGIVASPQLENAVAIMTFTNITKEPGDDWIGSGIAETVTADLKNIRGISVIGRERMFEVMRHLGQRQQNESDDSFAIDLGRRLGASWIIGGGYQRISDMIRITARFVDVGTGGLLKTVKIDGRIGEIFDLQDKIVYELSQGLNLQLGTSEISEIERDETKSVEAYEHFTRGMMNLRTASRDTLDRGIHHFEKATEFDPGYARAWAALGAVYDLKGGFLSIPELSEKAIEFEQKAIELNPRLSHAWQWLGGAYGGLGRYDEAIKAIEQAIRLEPNNAGAHASLARVYWIGLGKVDEAITELQHALTLNPQQGYAYLQLALLYTLRGDYTRAEAVARQAIDMQERYISGKEGLQIVGAHGRLGYVYYRQGRYDEAISEYEREMEFLLASDHALRDRTMIELDQKIGAAYLRKGMAEEADDHFKRARAKFEGLLVRGADDPHTKYYIACLYALEGDADNAVRYLEESIRHLRKINTLRAKTDPDFDSIRDDPRFIQLIGE